MCVVIFSITIHNNNHHNRFNNTKKKLFFFPAFPYKGDYLNEFVFLTAQNKSFIKIKEYDISTNGIELTNEIKYK